MLHLSEATKKKRKTVDTGRNKVEGLKGLGQGLQKLAEINAIDSVISRALTCNKNNDVPNMLITNNAG